MTHQMSSNTPKKILLLTSNPQGTTPLRLDEEVREIDAGLQRALHREQFELVQRWAVRPQDVRRAMLDEKPQIVHFSGHGAREEGLVFEDEVGQPKLVAGEALAGLFKLFASRVGCVVLNSCYSQVQAEAVAQHIPYVVGMKRAIGDTAAIAFAVGFYDALGAGETIEFAYELGCNAIQMEGIAEHLTPVLLKREKGAIAGDPSDSPMTTQPTSIEVNAKQTSEPLEVFISYSHKDSDLREELEMHLSNLRRQGKIKAWHDRAIEAGAEWDAEIKANLESAHVILLLISPRFMGSEYCYDIEMQRAMERHNAGTARVIPIILKPVDWKDTPFSKLQVLPQDGKPINTWDNQDEAFLNVVQGIRQAVESLKK